MVFVRRALAISALLSLMSAAHAATLNSVQIGNWTAGAYSNDQTGEFSHCAAIASYKSGILMGFAVNRSYGWSMAFANPQWNLQVGSRYPIAFTVDQIPALNATAIAVKNIMVEVPLADSTALFNVFRRGYMLTVFGAGQTFQFNLTGTSQILPILVACVHNHLAPPPVQAANPFEPQVAPPSNVNAAVPPSSDDASSARETEATTLIANVLSQAAVSGFTIMNPADAKQLGADAAWRTPQEVGTVNVIAADSNLSAEDLNASVIDRDSKGCKGKFLSGSVSDETNTKILRLFTSCNSDGKTVMGLYSIFPRAGGGFYVFAVDGLDQQQSTGTQSTLRSTDAEIRAAAYKVVVK